MIKKLIVACLYLRKIKILGFKWGFTQYWISRPPLPPPPPPSLRILLLITAPRIALPCRTMTQDRVRTIAGCAGILSRVFQHLCKATAQMRVLSERDKQRRDLPAEYIQSNEGFMLIKTNQTSCTQASRIALRDNRLLLVISMMPQVPGSRRLRLPVAAAPWPWGGCTHSYSHI